MSIPAAATARKGAAPVLLHRCPGRLRLRWAALRHPELRLEYFEAWLTRRAGLSRVRANPAGACLVAEYDERPGVADDILAALRQLPAEVFRPAASAPPPPRRRFIDAAAHLALAAGGSLLPANAGRALALGLGAPVLLRGLSTLASRGLKAPVLDLATVGFALATGDNAAARGISAMVVVGEYLRQATEDRSGALLKSLLAPPVALVRVELAGDDGPVERSLPFAEVRPGALVLVAAGEALPVDGVVERGRALVDKSVISGEAAPEEVAPGDALLAGSVVLDGALALRAVRTGPNCATGRIAALMERSLREKSRPERLSDRLADRLAPLTLALGAGIYAATGELRRALAVLTIDYACAVKLSAPVVVKSSMYAAAKAGVLVKSGSALDALAQADTLVFDKTGTLTTGRMAVMEVLPAGGPQALTPDELLLLAASAEERWSHPVARALVAEAALRGLALLPARGTQSATALGVRALVGAGSPRVVLVGGRRYLKEQCGLEAGDFCVAGQPGVSPCGKTLAHVAVDGRLAGVITLRDELRPEAAAVLSALRRGGVRRVLVLTGDNTAAAQALLGGLADVPGDLLPDVPEDSSGDLPGHVSSGPAGGGMGQLMGGLVDEIRAELSPEDKARIVRELRQGGACVAVVGDGVNDAPALLAANVGVCMAGQSLAANGLTRDSAGMVLLHEGLWGLAAAHKAARRAQRILRSCFGTGVAVNSALLLAAGAGRLSPLAAAAIHNGATFAIMSGAALAAGAPLPQQSQPEPQTRPRTK